MECLDIGLLGPPRIEAGGRPVEFDTRKAVAILARVTVEGPQRRDTLATLLWPESDPPRARGALRRTLSVLKGAFDGPVLAIDRDEVRLNPDTFRCDLDRFRELVARPRAHHDRVADVCSGCIDQLAAAVALHRGDFLAGFSLRDSADFDDWQFFQAEALRTELGTALDLLVSALAHNGRLAEAVEHVRRRLALDSLHEPTHRRLMLLHAWTGRREHAIRQYRDCVRILESELGVPPLDETTRLYQAILAGQPPPPPAPGREDDALAPREPRPARPSPAPDGPARLAMVGRREELDRLIELHRSSGEDGRLVVIEGEAGIGKTRLLDEFTSRARGSGAPTVTVRCYPGEEGLAYGPVADALRAITLGQQGGTIARSWLSEVARLVPELLDRHAGLSAPAPLGSPEADRRFFEGVRQTLAGTGSPTAPAVIAFEDLQWADASTRDVVTFLAHRLQAAPLCLVLTWRTAEVGREHPLRRLLTDPRDAIGATQFVLDRLDAEDTAELAGSAAVDGKAAERLFRETDGLPLLAVEYLRALAAGRLDDADWALPAGVRDLHVQRLAGLSETARQVLTTAAVLGHSFDLETLLHASGRTEEETVEALDELLAADILTEAPALARGDATYDFRHHTLRAVVYEEISIARRRLLHGRAARSLQRHGRATDSQVPLAVVAEHLRLAGEEEDAARMFVLAGDEARALAGHTDAVGHYRAALALDHPDPHHLHESIGDVLTLLGDYGGALTSYQASAARDSGPGQLARLEHKIAGVHERRGDWSAAEAHLLAAHTALPENGDPTVRAQLEAELSLAAHRRGATDEARSRAEASLSLAEDCGAALAAAQAHNILGMISRTQGDPEAAVTHLERSLQIAEEGDDPAPRVAALNNLALAYADRGQLPAALELGKSALAQCRSQGDRHHEAAILNNLADLLRAAGQEDEAMHHLKQAVTIFAEVGEPERFEPEIWKLVDW
jgi:DNA-binding SARP family transcriptional activator/tetratricopeptide (TPR) repeat protein